MGALVHEGFSGHLEDFSVIIDEPMEEGIPPIERHLLVKQLPDAVKTKAYKFYGNGNYDVKEWDLAECRGSEFCWYQVQLPKGDESQLSKYLIDVLGPLLKPRDILSLIKSRHFCGHVDDAVIFRVTSADPASTLFTSKLAVMVTGNSVISVSQERVLGRGFSSFKSPLHLEVPILEPHNGQQQGESSRFVIDEHMSAKHSEEADYSVPRSVSNLVIHIIDTYVAHQEDVVDKLETDLDELENINPGDYQRKQLLQGRSCAELLTKSQRFLQPAISTRIKDSDSILYVPENRGTFGMFGGLVGMEDGGHFMVIAHGEQVLPQVKRKCSSKQWLADADVCNLEELIGRLRKLKENVKFISKRAKTIQTDLQGRQSNQINRKLYCISLVTMVFLPLSLLIGVFGMNVGGIPWTSQTGHSEKQGFRNVMLLCAILVIVMLIIAMIVFYGFLNLLYCGYGWKIRVERLLCSRASRHRSDQCLCRFYTFIVLKMQNPACPPCDLV
ncbi:hypothetical protein AKJ16_DCAP14889 [Drosera capensis]